MVVPLSSGNSNDEVSSLSDSFFAPLCPPSSMASMIWFTTDFIFCSASTPDVPGGSSCCGGGGGGGDGGGVDDPFPCSPSFMCDRCTIFWS